MAKKTISVRVTQATFEEFEEYRHDEGTDEEPLSKADAGRKLIESGLENEKQTDTTARKLEEIADAADSDEPDRSGPLTLLMSLAGNDLRSQVNAFGLWMVFAALLVGAFAYVPGGPVWLAAAAVPMFAALSTLILGIGAGVVEQLDPEPTDSSETSSDAEVKQ
jgi:hypothetical protein